MIVYLNAQGKLTKDCTKTHLTYRFDVTEDIKTLCIQFSFSPPHLEDEAASEAIIYQCLKEQGIDVATLHDLSDFMPIKNYLTLSLDDPNGFRGAGHRHMTKQRVCVSDHGATPGFIQGELPCGQWAVTISVHAVVTELCNYTIKVYGEA